MEVVKLFSYGANMDISTLHQRHIRYIDYRVGVLMDYQFKFNKASINRTHSFANIQYRKGAKVVGILSTITINTLKLIDIYEGYPAHYNRIKLPIITDTDSVITANVYIGTSETLIEGLQPTNDYFEKIIRGRNLIRKLKLQVDSNFY